jgi:hypothetical protein
MDSNAHLREGCNGEYKATPLQQRIQYLVTNGLGYRQLCHEEDTPRGLQQHLMFMDMITGRYEPISATWKRIFMTKEPEMRQWLEALLFLKCITSPK